MSTNNTNTLQPGRVALVTGASRGIGLSIAKQLAASGIMVVGTATTQAGADQITEALSSCLVPGFGLPLVLSSTTDFAAFLKQVHDVYDLYPSILINNAGITDDNISFRLSEPQWSKVIDTNLTSTFLLTKQCLRPMLKARWGRVVTISSVVAVRGNLGQANYAASKAGLIGMSHSIAHEVASKNITMNLVLPGLIKTDMSDAVNEQHLEHLLQQVPLKRMGKPEDVAHLVRFLVSDEAEYITAQAMHVDGGMVT